VPSRSVLRRFNRDNLYLRREDRGSRRSTARRIARVVLVLVARRGVCSPLLASHPCSSRGVRRVASYQSIACRCALSERGVPSCVRARARTYARALRSQGGPPSSTRQASSGTEPVQAPTGPPICGNAPARKLPTIRHGCCWPCTRAAGFGTPCPSDPSATQLWGAGRRRHGWGITRHINNGLCPTNASEPSRIRTDSDALLALREQRSRKQNINVKRVRSCI